MFIRTRYNFTQVLAPCQIEIVCSETHTLKGCLKALWRPESTGRHEAKKGFGLFVGEGYTHAADQLGCHVVEHGCQGAEQGKEHDVHHGDDGAVESHLAQ